MWETLPDVLRKKIIYYNDGFRKIHLKKIKHVTREINLRLNHYNCMKCMNDGTNKKYSRTRIYSKHLYHNGTVILVAHPLCENHSREIGTEEEYICDSDKYMYEISLILQYKPEANSCILQVHSLKRGDMSLYIRHSVSRPDKNQIFFNHGINSTVFEMALPGYMQMTGGLHTVTSIL